MLAEPGSPDRSDKDHLARAHKDSRGDPHRRGIWRHVAQHDGVSADASVIPHYNVSQYFGPGADINMSANYGCTNRPNAERYLLKYKAVRAHYRSLVDHYSVWVGQQQSAPNASVQWDFGASHRAPIPMSNYGHHPQEKCNGILVRPPTLITSKARE